MDAIEFGRLALKGGGTGDKLLYHGERHALLFGTNGSGKGTRILASNLLKMDGSKSIVVIDPKGELLAITGRYRKTLGRVVVINPFGVLTEYYEDAEGVGFNPLARLNPDATSFNSDAALLSEAMVKASPNERDPHWTNSSRALCAMCDMGEVITARREGRTPTMDKVREMLCQASEAPHPGSAFSDPSEGKGIPKMACEMMRSPHAGLRNKAAQFTEWNREIQGIASTAKIQTECFDDPEIADNLARDDFDFADLRREPITVYIILPPSMLNRQSKWIRLLITSALQANMRPREPHEQRILFILDEAGSALGHMQILEDTWALVRGYGIQFILVFQDLNQLKAIYKERYETFIANAGILASFAPNDMTTAEFLSKRMGEKTKLNTTVTVTRGQSGGTSSGQGQSAGGGSINAGVNDGWSYNANANTGGVKLPFMSAIELFGLPTGYLVIIASGLSAVAFSYAPAYYEIPARKARARPNPYYDPLPRRPKPAASPKRRSSPAPEVGPNVQSRHPSYTPEPPKRLHNPAARHPGYAPRGNAADEDWGDFENDG